MGESSDSSDVDRLRTVAAYQFGAEAGRALLPSDTEIRIRRSTGGRPRQVIVDGDRVVSYGTDGRFTLGYAGGVRLQAALDRPACRVCVGDESIPFVQEGRNAFAKFVRSVDPAIRPGDEVLVEGPEGSLLGVGRAELSAIEMEDFSTGMAVKVREGSDQ